MLFLTGVMACGNNDKEQEAKDVNQSDIIRYDDVRSGHWPEPFQLVGIPSALDSTIQKAWYYPTSRGEPRPLLISLHTWSGDYNQKDTLAMMAIEAGWNYIHPDFRGPNWTFKACCSPYALADIDGAIDFAIEHGNVNTSRIYVNGVSGGGYAALAVYMRSRHQINTISAWVPISDLETWYEQSQIRNNKYAGNILDCTGSENGQLDTEEARTRSPLYWKSPDRDTRLYIFDGVHDGVDGSVPITQSINFYNKLANDHQVNDPEKKVTTEEASFLLENRTPIQNFGEIGDRAICLKKEFGKISLVIFDGNHEMLPEVAFEMFSPD